MKHQEVLRVHQLGKVYRSRSVIVGMPVGSAAGFLIAGAQEGFEDDRHRPQQKPKGRAERPPLTAHRRSQKAGNRQKSDPESRTPEPCPNPHPPTRPSDRPRQRGAAGAEIVSKSATIRPLEAEIWLSDFVGVCYGPAADDYGS